MSEETNEEAETVSAAAEEQTASVTQIADNAQSLTDQAAQLQEMVSSFKLGERTTELNGPRRRVESPDGNSARVTTDGGLNQ